MSAPTAAPAGEVEDGLPWKQIRDKAAAMLPVDVAMHIRDENSVEARDENGVLRLLVKPGFVYGRFNRADIISKISAAASQLCGREVRVLVAERQEQQRSQRSLDELKQFKEVRFI